jgi:hypothetical protein
MYNKLITNLTIDSLTFDGENYILQNLSGLESPTVRLPRYNLPGSSGAFISNALYGERSIKITGTINAPDNNPLTYLANRTALINALNFKRDIDNNIVPQLMTITLANGQILTTQVYVDNQIQMAFSSDKTDFEDFIITFVAPDYNLYGTNKNTSMITFPIEGGTAIPTPIPLSLSSSSGGSAIINNEGSSVTYPVITVNAPVINPYIINLTTNKFMQIIYTLNLGDEPLIIDCSQNTIFQGSNNLTGIQTQNSTFWGLNSGNNTINYSGTSGSGSCQLDYYFTYVGV